MKIEEIDIDDLLGTVCYESKWRFFACPVAYWILDYETYDPSVFLQTKDDDDFRFRDNLYRVDDKNFPEFLEALKEFELSLSEVRSLVNFNGMNEIELSIVINYEKKIYVNGFREINIEEYATAHQNS